MDMEEAGGPDPASPLSNSLAPSQKATPRTGSRISTRYSSTFPSSWATSDSQSPPDSPGIEPGQRSEISSPPRLTSTLGSQQQELLAKQRQNHLNRTPENVISTAIAWQASNGWTPPPVPLSARQFFPDRESYAEEVAQSSLGQRQRVIMPRTHDNTQTSPAVSVGHQSASTASPYHGRDLPAKGPSLSPAYSVV